MKIIAVIPARFNSSRFPGKPLAKILGKSMIWWVFSRLQEISEISNTYVATDDKRIFDEVESFGGKAIMTGECACGTERVYEACKDMHFDIVLNIQGDEPMIQRELVLDLISAFKDKDVYMATLMKHITSDAEIADINIAKIVTDCYNNAIYFSRSPIPCNRNQNDKIFFYKHIGLYGYKKDFLKQYVKLPVSPLEIAEALEQLRVIEHGFKIIVIETKYQSIGVDIPEHISIVEKYLEKKNIIGS